MRHVFPSGSDGLKKKKKCLQCRRLGLIPGLERSSGEENGNPLQCSCLENSTDRGGWRATIHGVAKSRTLLSDTHTQTHTQVVVGWYILVDQAVGICDDSFKEPSIGTHFS